MGKKTNQQADTEIISLWEDSWKLNPDTKTRCMKTFYELYMSIYKDVKQKKEKNNRMNFKVKMIFIGVFLMICLVYVVLLLWNVFEQENSLTFIENGMLFILLIGLCSIISKWLDIKKYQETWVRHSLHQYLLDQEMLRFVYQLAPYNNGQLPEVFIERVLKIEEQNEMKFVENMEKGEKSLMDIFDKLK